MNETTHSDLIGTIVIIVITMVLFLILNTVPFIYYTFRFFEVFGMVMAALLLFLLAKPDYLNTKSN